MSERISFTKEELRMLNDLISEAMEGLGEEMDDADHAIVQRIQKKIDAARRRARCKCPVGSYDRGNTVHEPYCPLAVSPSLPEGEPPPVPESSGR